MIVPFLDVGFTYRDLKGDIDTAIQRVMDSGMYIQGDEVTAFENEFADWSGASHCIGTGNGLDALFLGLKAVGVGPGDEVIVPSHTFIATWLAVSRLDAKLIPVEPDPVTYQISADACAAAITPKTKAIVPVHLYGHPCDMPPILALAAEHGIKVVTDAAQAHGAKINGADIGAMGDVVAWSFYPGKNLGAFGDGGAVTTDDPELALLIRQLGNYGSREKYVHELEGINSRLDPLQAAAMRVKLTAIDRWTERRRAIAGVYLDRLSGLGLTLPGVANWADPAWHLFVVRGGDRKSLMQRLAENGVASAIHYPLACHHQGAYRNDFAEQSFPLAEAIATDCISLPIGPHIELSEAEQICDAVTLAMKSLA